MAQVRKNSYFALWAVMLVGGGWTGHTTVEARQPDVLPSQRAPVLPRRSVLQGEFLRDPAQYMDVWRGVPGLQMDAVDVMALANEDAVRDEQPGVPMRIGVNRTFPSGPISAATHGEWTQLADGARLWSMKIDAMGAMGLRLHFSHFDLPRETMLLLRGDSDEAPQVYTGSGPLRKSFFWAPMTMGETVYLEYQDRSGRARAPRITISEISHIYRGFGPSEGDMANSDAEVVASGPNLPCHRDVNCYGAEAVARDSVARITFTPPGQGTFLCSGALIEDADENTFAGYFLTANHCLSTQEVADTLTAYWFYQTDACQGTLPSLSSVPKSLGAVLLATSSLSDFTFLRLLDDPRDGQGFAPLTTDIPEVNDTVACIHHPDGSFKRYADGPVTLNQPICVELPLERYIYNKWTAGRGVTEGGSSGAPLFNENWEVVGQLFGACAFANPGCFNLDQYNAVSGRMSFTYPFIASFLETITSDDEYEPNDSLEDAASITAGTHELRLVDHEDYFKITIAEPHEIVVSITFDPQDFDADLRLLSLDGTELDVATAFSGFASVSGDVVAGQYVIRTSKMGGWGGDYTLEIDLLETNCVLPAGVMSEVPATPKNRYISFEPADDVGVNAAIRVSFAALNRLDGVNPGSPDFSSSEGGAMWVGPPELFNDPTESPPGFLVARLQCTPHYADWSGLGLIHVYGPEIVPSSTYEVGMIAEHCTMANPQNFTEPLALITNRWGDVAPPHWPESQGQPNFSDISAIVGSFGNAPNAISRLQAQLQPHVPDPGLNVSFSDISAGIDAFGGLPYPFFGPGTCP